MRWEDERWIKVYTRDTAEWLALGWEAQALFLLLLRKSDRAGLIHSGRARVRGLAALVAMPLEVVERALPILLEDGCVRETDGGHLIPNFIAAQEAETSGAQRSRTLRERDRDKALVRGTTSKTTADTVTRMGRTDATQSATFVETPATTQDETQSATQVVTVLDTPRVDETRVDEISSSKRTASPSPGGFELTSPASKKQRRQREPSAAEALFKTIQATREARCVEAGAEIIPERWDFAKQNKIVGGILREPEAAQRLFEAAWGIYLADDGHKIREPAWSFSYFLTVRSRYETRAAREGEA